MDIKDIDPTRIRGTLQGKWNSIIYITGGNGVLQIDFDEFIALGNRIFFIEKYKVWNLNKANNLRGYLVQFTDIFYNHIYTGNPKLKSDQTLIGEIPPFIRIHQHDKSEWRLVLDTLSYEYLSARTNSREIICLELKIMMLMYRRNSMFANNIFESRRKKQLLNEFKILVNNSFTSLRSTKDYAQDLNITPNYLNALCQEFYLKTVSEIIKERIILEAKRLLMHSSLSISEVAFKLGFKDNSYFGRYFKKETGMTPKNFKRLCFRSTRD
jgi:AraC-like DNA-binding protein